MMMNVYVRSLFQNVDKSKIKDDENETHDNDNSEWYQKIKVYEANKNVNFKLDSGAQISILPKNVYEQLGEPNIDKLCKDVNVKLSTYNKQKLDVVGTVRLNLLHRQ